MNRFFIFCFILTYLYISLSLYAQSVNEVIHDMDLYEKNIPYHEIWNDKLIYINRITEDDLINLEVFSKDEVRKILIQRKINPIKSIRDIESIIKDHDKIELLKDRIIWDTESRNQFRSKAIYTVNKVNDQYFYIKNTWQNKLFKMAFLSEKDPDDRKFPDLMKYSLAYQLPDSVKNGVQAVYTGSYTIQSGNSLLFSASPYYWNNLKQTIIRSDVKSDVNRSEFNNLNGFSSRIVYHQLQIIPLYSVCPIWIIKDTLNQIVSINKTGIHADRDEEKDYVTAYGIIADISQKNIVTGLSFINQRYPLPFAVQTNKQHNQTLSQFSQIFINPFQLRYEYAVSNRKRAYHFEFSWQKEHFFSKTGYRQYPQFFPENYGNPYSQRADFRNERGIYYLLNGQISKLNFEFQTDLFQYNEPESGQPFSKRGSENYLRLIYHINEKCLFSIKSIFRVSDVIYQQELTQMKRKSLTLSHNSRENTYFSHQTILHLLTDQYENDTQDRNGVALLQKVQIKSSKYCFSFTSGVFKTQNSIYLPLYSQSGMNSYYYLQDTGFLFTFDSTIRINPNFINSVCINYISAKENQYKVLFSLSYKY